MHELLQAGTQAAARGDTGFDHSMQLETLVHPCPGRCTAAVICPSYNMALQAAEETMLHWHSFQAGDLQQLGPRPTILMPFCSCPSKAGNVAQRFFPKQ